ncbi:unnamed protein product [Penicillium viridicatum]
MFAWMLIPLFERIDVSLEKYGDFNSLQKFRLALVNYYIKHDPRLKDFNLGELLQGLFAFDLMLRYSVQRDEYWKQKCHKLKLKKKAKGEEKQLQQYISLRKVCSMGYWRDEQRLYKLESLLPAGPFRMTAQEEVDAAAVSVVAVKNVNQLPEDAGELVTAL